MVTRYGVISDMHSINLDTTLYIISSLKEKAEINGLILNGDIIGEMSGMRTSDYLYNLLQFLGLEEIETYILPGSHEIVEETEAIIKHLQTRFPNLIYTVEEPIIDKKDHHLVFISGSDWRPGEAVNRGYVLGKSQYESGLYQDNEGNIFRVINLDDLKKNIRVPEKTILFSHVPRRFYNEKAVDLAEFGEVKEDFYLNGGRIEKGSVFPGPIAYQLFNLGAPIEIKRENRGNEDLERILEEIGIKKHITGHFHESVHNAHNSSGQPIEEKGWTDELFLMASYLDEGKCSIIEVDNNKIRYFKIELA